MNEKQGHCQYYYADLTLDTCPDTRLALPLRRYWWTLKKYVWFISVSGLRESVSKMFPFTQLNQFAHKRVKKMKPRAADGHLNLETGDLVEVRPVKEILATLDAKGKLRGLTFTPEMAKFCGNRFRVYKKLDKIILEATGELRKIRSPTVLLENVFCDGKAHGSCDRSCFCFWREDWLKRIPTDSNGKQM